MLLAKAWLATPWVADPPNECFHKPIIADFSRSHVVQVFEAAVRGVQVFDIEAVRGAFVFLGVLKLYDFHGCLRWFDDTISPAESKGAVYHLTRQTLGSQLFYGSEKS